MRKLFFIICIFFSIICFSQSIKGKVVDEKNQPLVGANVYFDGTTIATITDENGSFTLNYSSKINSILAISFIGFQTQYLSNVKSNEEINIVLKELINSLNEVIIKKDRFTRKQKLQLFREQFLGRSENAKNTKIENEDAIYFEYDEKTMTLKAFSDVPLIIFNNALKYKITYELINFEAKFSTKTLNSYDVFRSYYVGLTRFEELITKENNIKKREKAYQGSQLHFFRNLVTNIWDKKNFLLFKGSFQDNPSDYFKITESNDLYKVEVVKQNKSLANKEFIAEFNLLFNKKKQSKIIFETDTFYVDKFGNNSNIENIIFSGDLSQQKVGDMLPMNYRIE